MNENRDFPNSGTLFRNDRKTNDRAPDLRGSADVSCPHCGRRGNFWLSAWTKAGRNGGKFLSLAFRTKDEAELPAPPPPGRDDDIDDIPWK